jgi:hypothetical protein
VRRGAEAGATLLLAGCLAGLPIAAAQSVEPDEDLAGTEAVLAAYDQPPTAEERSELAAAPLLAGDGRLTVHWQGDATAEPVLRARLEASGRGWLLKGRLRRPSVAPGPDVALQLGQANLRTVAGGWTWRSGSGLLMGGAGRQGTLAADASLLPGASAPRGWTGGAEDGAAVGAIVSAGAGPWSAVVGGGRTADGERLAVAALGRASGSWQALLARQADGPVSFGVSGRQKSRRLDAAWEAAWTGGRAARPAMAAAVGFTIGRPVRFESAAWVVPTGPSPAGAGALPLLGRDPGSAAALRCRWRPSAAVAAALAVGAGRREDRDGPGREDRRSGEALIRLRFLQGAAAELRLRSSRGTTLAWSSDHPWAAPVPTPMRSTRTLGLVVRQTGDGRRWRVGLRSLAVDHAATTGRRTLVTAEFGGTAAGASWRLGWRRLWGEPVDLVDAFAPLPGLVLPRHWGRWDSAWQAACQGVWGALEGAFSVEIRRPSAGAMAVTCWAGVTAAW